MTMSEPMTAPAPGDQPVAGAELGAVAAPAAPVPVPPAPVDVPAAMPPAPQPAPAVGAEAPHAGSAPAAAGRAPVGAGRRSLDVLANVEMTVTVELGRTRMPVRQLLGLAPGSVIELNRSANTPVDVFVNGTLFARGEVVVIDDEFGVRITDIVERDADSPLDRI